MKKIGVFFGSDTGNTEEIAFMIQKELNLEKKDVYDISKCKKKDIEYYEILIFGIPTWYYGEAQCDWDDFFPILKKINFDRKMVAIFGCGDQEDYTEYFCDAMKFIYDIVVKNGAKILGKWSTKGYFFESSKAVLNSNFFLGLTIDQDRQPEMTKNRVKQWCKKTFN